MTDKEQITFDAYWRILHATGVAIEMSMSQKREIELALAELYDAAAAAERERCASIAGALSAESFQLKTDNPKFSTMYAHTGSTLRIVERRIRAQTDESQPPDFVLS